MFDFISKAFDSTIGKALNSALKPFTDILKETGLTSLLEPCLAMLDSIPGLGPYAGLGKVGIDILEDKVSLGDCLKVGACFAPPPANTICSLADMDTSLAGIFNNVGNLDPSSPEFANLLEYSKNFMLNSNVA